MSCEDCVYSEIVDWEEIGNTGKAEPILFCKKQRLTCENTCERFKNYEESEE